MLTMRLPAPRIVEVRLRMKLQKLEVRLQREADRDWGGLWDLHLLQMRVTRLGMMWQPARSQPFPRGRGGGGGGGI